MQYICVISFHCRIETVHFSFMGNFLLPYLFIELVFKIFNKDMCKDKELLISFYWSVKISEHRFLSRLETRNTNAKQNFIFMHFKVYHGIIQYRDLLWFICWLIYFLLLYLFSYSYVTKKILNLLEDIILNPCEGAQLLVWQFNWFHLYFKCMHTYRKFLVVVNLATLI